MDFDLVFRGGILLTAESEFFVLGVLSCLDRKEGKIDIIFFSLIIKLLEYI